MALRVTVEHLTQSGLAVTGHGEDVAIQHAAAGNRIDAAQAGWQGMSATALAALAERWNATTHALLTRMSDHAVDLHACAQGFIAMEQRHRQALRSPAEAAEAVTGHTYL